jgi:hypothetical protein
VAQTKFVFLHKNNNTNWYTEVKKGTLHPFLRKNDHLINTQTFLSIMKIVARHVRIKRK